MRIKPPQPGRGANPHQFPPNFVIGDFGNHHNDPGQLKRC
jgi:hypothetical protein